MAEPTVIPTEPTPPAPEVTPRADVPAPEAPEASIPPEVAQIPAVAALLQGQPAALSIDLNTAGEKPEFQTLMQAKDALMEAGLATYRALSGNIGVIFNQLAIHPEEIKAADRAGQLQQVAPPWDTVNTAAAQAGEGHPALLPVENHPGLRGAMPQTPQAAPPAFPAGGMPAEGANKLAKARLKNMQAGPPAGQSRPSKLLSEINKPVL